MVWIYAFESDPKFGPDAQTLLNAIDLGRHTLLTSYFLLAELLVAPVKRQNGFLSAAYRRAILARSGHVIPFTERAANTFAHIRATEKVSPPDAIHLALAGSAGVDVFVTGDTQVKPLLVPGVGEIVGLGHKIV